MSEYEKALKPENEILGYRFLYDTPWVIIQERCQEKPLLFARVPNRKIKVILGDCIDSKHGVSRYLVFENVMGLWLSRSNRQSYKLCVTGSSPAKPTTTLTIRFK